MITTLKSMKNILGVKKDKKCIKSLFIVRCTFISQVSFKLFEAETLINHITLQQLLQKTTNHRKNYTDYEKANCNGRGCLCQKKTGILKAQARKKTIACFRQPTFYDAGQRFASKNQTVDFSPKIINLKETCYRLEYTRNLSIFSIYPRFIMCS